MKTPRTRNPFRLLFNALYIALVAYTAIVLLMGAWKGARTHQGDRPDPVPRESVNETMRAACVSDLEELHAELRSRLETIFVRTPAQSSARKANVEWEAWSPAWRARLLDVGARCRLEENDVPEAAPIRAAYLGLGQLHRHYTTLSVQFSQEIGPSSDRLNAAMEKARTSVERTLPDTH